MAKEFEINFRGRSDNDVDYDTGLRISGDLETIGRLFAEYAAEASRRGQHEPVTILIAAFKQMQRLHPEEQGKIIKPKFMA
jgi:hypothetical protein